jgi:uncharacterized membrane protein
MKRIKLTSDECFIAVPLILNLVIQGKLKEAEKLAKTFQTPTGSNFMYKYNETIKSIKKNKLKFTKKKKDKAKEQEKEYKKELRILGEFPVK